MMDCEGTRERIPDLAASRLDEASAASVEDHVRACPECAAELELASALFATRPSVPDGLSGRVTAAVRRDRRRTGRPWWGLAAAAVAALALGIGVASEQPSTDFGAPGFAYELGEEDLWIGDDGLIAGAPALDDLSDEALAQLLDELQAGSSGGAA